MKKVTTTIDKIQSTIKRMVGYQIIEEIFTVGSREVVLIFKQK